MPDLSTAALADDTTIWLDSVNRTGPSRWLGGLDLADFEGATEGDKLVSAAASINASIFSPSSERASSPPSPSDPAFVEFATPEMIKRAHDLGMVVKVWTVNDLSRVEQLFARGVQGILTDCEPRLVEPLGPAR